MSSNGWDNDTAALQLFSHLEGDALEALLVPLSRWLYWWGPYRPTTDRRVGLRRPLEPRGKTSPYLHGSGDISREGLWGYGTDGSLRLIRDRFIAGHSSCELRRHLDSVPPETPIRDVVDRCCIWESHADPAVRRASKPSPDSIYPAFVVGNSDSISETTRVAAVTQPRSGPDQLEDLLRQLLMAVDSPAPIPEVSPSSRSCYSVW